jgi:hypothetical protein
MHGVSAHRADGTARRQLLASGGSQLLRVAPTGELETGRLSDSSLNLWFSPEKVAHLNH